MRSRTEPGWETVAGLCLVAFVMACMFAVSGAILLVVWRVFLRPFGALIGAF